MSEPSVDPTRNSPIVRLMGLSILTFAAAPGILALDLLLFTAFGVGSPDMAFVPVTELFIYGGFFETFPLLIPSAGQVMFPNSPTLLLLVTVAPLAVHLKIRRRESDGGGRDV